MHRLLFTPKMKSIPTEEELNNIFFNEDECKTWLIDKKIIQEVRKCETCNMPMLLNLKRESYRHTCQGKRKELSMWKNTLFSKSKLSPNKIMKMLYNFLLCDTHKSIKTRGGHGNTTVTQLIRDANQMITNMIEPEDTMVGGVGIIVEIDESKLSKRKYNKGHRVNGVWVIGGVEITAERKMFAIPVEKRDAETIAEIINTHVIPGSIIRTDCWRGYGFLSKSSDYIHEKVNHSLHFKDPTTQVHTNTIEGTWAAIKSKIAKRYRCEGGIENHIHAFIWRRQNETRLWNALLDALKDYHWLEDEADDDLTN